MCEWNRCSRRQNVIDQQQKGENVSETDQVDIEEGVKVLDLEALRSQIYKKKVNTNNAQHQNKQCQFGRIKKMNSPHTYKS